MAQPQLPFALWAGPELHEKTIKGCLVLPEDCVFCRLVLPAVLRFFTLHTLGFFILHPTSKVMHSPSVSKKCVINLSLSLSHHCLVDPLEKLSPLHDEIFQVDVQA